MQTHPRRWPEAFVLVLVVAGAATTHAWGPQGHRLVARVASEHLTEVARRNVTWLLGRSALHDVAVWADQQEDRQTATWHYVNIPADARTYDRRRDCPPPRQTPRDRSDRWRDCVVDRILYNQERLADGRLTRADRAVALKFLVHLVGDIHQPFHAIGVERGGNGIAVSAFGSETCGSGGREPRPCNLHGIWDTTLIARRRLSDTRYLALLAPYVNRHKGRATVNSTPAAWAAESHRLARAALLKEGADAGDTYYRTHAPVVDEQMALGGLRLAALLNRALTSEPPAR